MTAIRRDGNDTPFSDWMRKEKRIDSRISRIAVADIDFTIHQYRHHKDKIGERAIDSLMEIELKTWGRDLPFSQRDTWLIKEAMFREAFGRKDGKIKQMRIRIGSEIRLVRHYGFFTLRLEKERPDDGGWIRWNGELVDLDTLVDILRFEIDPRTRRRRRKNERRSHRASVRQSHPELPLSIIT